MNTPEIAQTAPIAWPLPWPLEKTRNKPPSPRSESSYSIYLKRKRIGHVALALSLAAMAFGIFWLCWILWETVYMGVSGLNWALFTKMTPAPGEAHEMGGLANAIYGSFIMVLLATAIGTPVGIMAGVYLAEYGKHNTLASATRFAGDILLSAPGIVIGLFIHAIIVVPLQGFSGWAGVASLALIVIPVVIRTTENMLLLVPASLREAAFALGAPQWKMVSMVTLRAARAGIVTGVLLAVARIAGETAPLLFTALNHQFWSTDLTQPVASLPVTIFKFALSPYENWQRLAWAGVLLITLTALALNILARALTPKES